MKFSIFEAIHYGGEERRNKGMGIYSNWLTLSIKSVSLRSGWQFDSVTVSVAGGCWTGGLRLLYAVNDSDWHNIMNRVMAKTGWCFILDDILTSWKNVAFS